MISLVAVAAALRARAMFTDLSLDEVWSYDAFARRATSVWDIFLNPAFRHDNNQHLNTLFLYLLRGQTSWAVYRIPSLVAGLATVAVVTWIGSQRSRIEGLIGGALVAMSFLMVVSSTEARGYAWLVLFAALAYASLSRYLKDPSLSTAWPFWLWVGLGVTAHSAIAHFYLGALLWSGFRLRGRARDFWRLHAPPIAFGMLWAAVVLRGALIGGGPPWTWRQIGDQSFAWTLGYPTGLIPAAIVALLAVALLIWDARASWLEGSDEGLFFIGVLIGPPIFVIALAPAWLFPRYFLISLFFLLLLISRAFGRLALRVPSGSWVAAALIALMAAGNLRHIVPFSSIGHGEPSQAVRYMLDHSTDAHILVTGEPVDVRISIPLTFYSRYWASDGRTEYVRRADVGRSVLPSAIDWLVVEPEDQQARLAPTVHLAGVAFQLRGTYPAYGPSSFPWFLYERDRP